MSAVRSVAQALAESPAAALVRRAADSQRLARALAAADTSLPFDPLTPGACELRGSTVLMTVASPAVAAKLRQRLPQLTALLHRQGFELTEIKVRLQPARTSYRTGGSGQSECNGITHSRDGLNERRSNLTAALDLAEKLALTLPSSPVGQAAHRLAESLRNRLARTG